MSSLKNELLEELKLRCYLEVEGVGFDPEIFKEELTEDPGQKAVHNCFDMSLDNVIDIQIPGEIRVGHGLKLPIHKNSRSPYSIIREPDGFYIVQGKEKLLKAFFAKPAELLSKKTSDGVWMKTIAGAGCLQYEEKELGITYSNECALIEKGKDCLFCNINATKARYADKECIQWKYPKHIAETVKAAYEEGYDQFNITGGLVAERRELDYYLDTIEQIAEHLDTRDFKATACIGAPKDLSVIDRYKEAGYHAIAFNMEVWGRDFFHAICAGKVEACGDFDHWVKALKYAVEVFGRGNVRSSFVSGLQPMEYYLDAAETLTAEGIVAMPYIWVPNIGSKYEGHRTPTPEWHWELQNKVYAISKRNGITYEDIYYSTSSTYLLNDIYRVEEETHPIYQQFAKGQIELVS